LNKHYFFMWLHWSVVRLPEFTILISVKIFVTAYAECYQNVHFGFVGSF